MDILAADLINRGAQYYKNNTAVIFEGEKRTFKEVNDNANRIANMLHAYGLRKGDRVAFLLANSVQSVEIDFAVIKSGLVRVPLNTRLSSDEHLHMLKETEAKAILFTEEFGSRVQELKKELPYLIFYGQMTGESPYPGAAEVDKIIHEYSSENPDAPLFPDDPCTIQYTSGTTGTLKAAVHTQQSWAEMTFNILSTISIGEDDIMLHAAPLTHASGTLVLPFWIKGGSNAILSGFNPKQFLETVQEIGPTTLNLVPTMVTMLLHTPGVESYAFDSVKNIIYGASPMPKKTLQQGLKLWGPKFIQYYGQSEVPLMLSTLTAKDHIEASQTPEKEKLLLSCGRPLPSTKLKIVNEKEEEIGTGEIGEIVVQSRQGMKEYWRAPELNKEMMKDGWIFTRDMGYVDEHGYLFLVDRKSDMIISGGFNIYPREVEEVLYEHADVKETAVIGVPDEKWGEAVKGFVVLKEGSTVSEEELILFCKEKLASYKKPKTIEFIDDLPKSAVGKVVRRVLREPFWNEKERQI